MAILLALLTAIGILWWRANAAYERTGDWIWRARRAAFSWAFIGAMLGANVGLVWGGAGGISGALPAALLAYAAAQVMFRWNRLGQKPRVLPPLVGACLGASIMQLGGVAAFGGAANAWWVGALAGWLGVALLWPRRMTQEAPGESHRGRGVILKASKWLFTSVALAAVAVVIVVTIDQESRPKQSAGPVQQTSPSSASTYPRVDSQQTRRAAYDEKVRELEALYPALNPDSPQYDAGATQAVLTRARQLADAGREPADAVAAAASEVFAPRAPLMVTAPPAPVARAAVSRGRPLPKDCVFKGVMTDDEYRACGVRPPGSY